MPKIADILRFRDEQFFDGAVQLDWFYEPDKKAIASSSFVFHGPEYYAVSRDDIRVSLSLELVDTCSFAQMLAHRVYRDGEDTPRIGNSMARNFIGLTLQACLIVSEIRTLKTHLKEYLLRGSGYRDGARRDNR